LDTPPIENHIELQPEHQVLHLELSTKRKDLVAELQGRAIKSVRVSNVIAAIPLNIRAGRHRYGY
jgi:E3 ubiquitin-protein ligase SHPRH